jgi:hypothetical protein
MLRLLMLLRVLWLMLRKLLLLLVQDLCRELMRCHGVMMLLLLLLLLR